MLSLYWFPVFVVLFCFLVFILCLFLIFLNTVVFYSFFSLLQQYCNNNNNVPLFSYNGWNNTLIIILIYLYFCIFDFRLAYLFTYLPTYLIRSETSSPIIPCFRVVITSGLCGSLCLTHQPRRERRWDSF